MLRDKKVILVNEIQTALSMEIECHFYVLNFLIYNYIPTSDFRSLHAVTIFLHANI